jgi:hypothetical protein
MNYSVEIGSGNMTYIPSFTDIDSGTHKFLGGEIQRGDLISLL